MIMLFYTVKLKKYDGEDVCWEIKLHIIITYKYNYKYESI